VTGDKDGMVSWPRLEAREFAEDANALSAMHSQEQVSLTTMHERLNIDPDVERERMDEEFGPMEDRHSEESDEDLYNRILAAAQNQGNGNGNGNGASPFQGRGQSTGTEDN